MSSDRTQEGLLTQTSCLCHSLLLVKSSLLDILPKNYLYSNYASGSSAHI